MLNYNKNNFAEIVFVKWIFLNIFKTILYQDIKTKQELFLMTTPKWARGRYWDVRFRIFFGRAMLQKNVQMKEVQNETTFVSSPNGTSRINYYKIIIIKMLAGHQWWFYRIHWYLTPRTNTSHF